MNNIRGLLVFGVILVERNTMRPWQQPAGPLANREINKFIDWGWTTASISSETLGRPGGKLQKCWLKWGSPTLTLMCQALRLLCSFDLALITTLCLELIHANPLLWCDVHASSLVLWSDSERPPPPTLSQMETLSTDNHQFISIISIIIVVHTQTKTSFTPWDKTDNTLRRYYFTKHSLVQELPGKNLLE